MRSHHGFRSRRAALLAAAVIVLTVLWRVGVIAPPAPPVVLVVGDSLVVGAAPALDRDAPSGVSVAVLAGVGASPCDVLAGYRQPAVLGGGTLSYRDSLDGVSPKAVVLAFTGNPGLSPHACVAATTGDYTLAGLLASYRAALTTMGRLAEEHGARVYLAGVPSRNPAAPEGWDGTSQHGYNGDPALNTMLSGLARTHGWVFDDDPAQFLDAPQGGWSLVLPCVPTDGTACHNGRVQVRVGGTDPIHCDAPGTNGPGSESAGSARYAEGLLRLPLESMGRSLVAPSTTPTCAP